jgi:hypothetical protein
MSLPFPASIICVNLRHPRLRSLLSPLFVLKSLCGPSARGGSVAAPAFLSPLPTRFSIVGRHPVLGFMLRIAVIASGKDYQEAAAWAAPTYVRHLGNPSAVSVLLPVGEKTWRLLGAHAKEYGFGIAAFPFTQKSAAKFTSQLKCQAFYYAVSRLGHDDLLFLVDADTYCAKPLTLKPRLKSAILAGKIGLVPDVRDNHCRNPAEPWYLTAGERKTYVNSGVILCSRSAAGLFKVFKRLSGTANFLRGPFNDQKVINFALGKYFGDQLLLLDKAYNGMRQFRSPATIIGHCAGGAGRLAEGAALRKREHKFLCARILNSADHALGTA